MFRTFDKLSLRAKTWLIVVFGFIGVLLQIIPAWSEPRQSVQILYLAIAVGFVAMMGMLLSSVRSIDRMEKQIQMRKDQPFVEDYKKTMGRILGEIGNTYEELENVLNKQNGEQSRKILASLKEPFAENKRLIKKLESI